MGTVKSRASLRTEQAAQTRRRILRAAADVFAEQGFAAARIEDIAEHAGVAVPTIYKTFTNKRNLLVGALNQAMTDGESGARIDEQSWWTEQLNERDPIRQLQLVARNARRIYERSGALLSVLQTAVPVEAELAAVWNDIASQRLDRSRRTAISLARKAGERARLSREDTTLTLLTLTEPALFTVFTSHGKTAGQYETWLADVLSRTLLG
jgi:AcrR family transcriptional regulator